MYSNKLYYCYFFILCRVSFYNFKHECFTQEIENRLIEKETTIRKYALFRVLP